MATNNFLACLAVTLAFEGGYTVDDGGPTMRGITQSEYNAWRARNKLPSRTVKQISDDELHTIYHDEYWVKVNAENLPLGVDLCVFDSAVNSGVGRSLQWLKAAGQDIDKLCSARMFFLKNQMNKAILRANPGLIVRVNDLIKKAHEMANAKGNP